MGSWKPSKGNKLPYWQLYLTEKANGDDYLHEILVATKIESIGTNLQQNNRLAKIKSSEERTPVRSPKISLRKKVDSEKYFKNAPRTEIQFFRVLKKILDSEERLKNSLDGHGLRRLLLRRLLRRRLGLNWLLLLLLRLWRSLRLASDHLRLLFARQLSGRGAASAELGSSELLKMELLTLLQTKN